MIATGLRADGHRVVLGVDVADSENETFWTEFLRDLKDRGLASPTLLTAYDEAMTKARTRLLLVPTTPTQIPSKIAWLQAEMLKTRVAHG